MTAPLPTVPVRRWFLLVAAVTASLLTVLLGAPEIASAETLVGIESPDGTYSGPLYSPSDPSNAQDDGRQEYNVDLNGAGAQAVRVTLLWSDIATDISFTDPSISLAD